MNKNFNQKMIIIYVVLAIVMIIAATMFWNKKTTAKADENTVQNAAKQKSDHTKKANDEAEEADDDVIHMDQQQMQTANIQIAQSAPASITNTITLPGEIRFNEDRTAHIVPRLSGVAESVSADLGQRVKKGQVLAVISSPELAELRSTSMAAQKRLSLARLTYEREKKLWQDKISAEQDYLQAQQAYREAEINAQTSKSTLSALNADDTEGKLNRYVLRAPFDGIVIEKHIALGEAVKEDANVFLISDLSSVWVEVVLTPKDLESARIGDEVTIRSTSTNLSAVGKINYIGNLLGEQTRTAKARVVITNPNLAWRPGLFVNVALSHGKKDLAVTVQSDAIQTLEGKTVVFIKVPNGFKARVVTTGVSDGKLTEILDGMPIDVSYAAAGSFVVKAEAGKESAEHAH
ncbi:efflux RND transporter periplasmic adaptor subunit [Undibacterium jejuense]|uniref:Efflux RND transporter periplasmic adaptor subunit n=2 Tax=Undibacterium jejuense TaxID=1344949 RepID=A0A923KQQ2_9BURK|nr:efflux RND transporter periplasmic adaptor subunit [Undibacterium jejuense]MBC3863111.1 efflux RND transporter periplasmic adaptor subunit [Undibacterium jejuense]